MAVKQGEIDYALTKRVNGGAGRRIRKRLLRAVPYVLFAVFIGIMWVATGVAGERKAKENNYRYHEFSILTAQKIFAGERTTECVLVDKERVISRGVSFYDTFSCQGNGSNPTPGVFRVEVDARQFRSLHTDHHYRLEVLDWGKKPELPRYSFTPVK